MFHVMAAARRHTGASYTALLCTACNVELRFTNVTRALTPPLCCKDMCQHAGTAKCACSPGKLRHTHSSGKLEATHCRAQSPAKWLKCRTGSTTVSGELSLLAICIKMANAC